MDTAGYSTTLSGVLSGAGGLNKRGEGTLTLGGADSYAGVTSIYAGTLALAAAASIGNSSLIDVKSGAWFDVAAKTDGFGLSGVQTLMGAGTVTGSIAAAAGSRVAPGDGVGMLTITGSLTLSDGALLGYELGTLGSSDLISMSSSTLYLNGLEFSDFEFTALSGFGEGTYTLIDAATTSGSMGNNCTGMIGRYRGTLSVVGGDLVLRTTAVPEPGMLAMLIAAGAGTVVGAWWRRR